MIQLFVQLNEMAYRGYKGKTGICIWTRRQNRARAHVYVYETFGNGSCLYQAMSHQLFQTKMTTQELHQAARSLREEVVEHIKENFERYIMDIKLNMTEQAKFSEMNLNEITDKQCQDYLNDDMLKDITWGGGESMKAVSELYKTNVFVFMEHSHNHSYNNRFDGSYEKTIILAYRLNGETRKYYHYDSVTSIDMTDLKEIIDDINKYANTEPVELRRICEL